MTTTVFGQKTNTQFYVGGNPDHLPNVQLYLAKDSSYDLKLFSTDCYLWQFLKGKYYYEKDSLVLVYHTLYEEPLCRVIDTFYKPRTLKLLYVNDKNKVVDKLSLDLDHDTVNVDHFPLDYVDTAIVRRGSSPITYTYYAPYFAVKSQSVPFYKPKRKFSQTYFIKLKVDGNNLKPSDTFKWLFKPFESLVRQ